MSATDWSPSWNHQLPANHSTTLVWIPNVCLTDFCRQFCLIFLHLFPVFLAMLLFHYLFTLFPRISLLFFPFVFFFHPSASFYGSDTCFQSNRNWSKTCICPVAASIVGWPWFVHVALCSTCNLISDIYYITFSFTYKSPVFKPASLFGCVEWFATGWWVPGRARRER